MARVIYLAQENADSVEGRGPMVTFAAFFKKKDAKDAVRGRGPMGGGDGSVEELTVYDSSDEYFENCPEEVRRRALGKLTPREREVLGV